MWKSFTWKDTTDQEDLAKVFDKFENSLQIPNMQWGCREKAYNLKQQEDETVEQLDIRLTNILCKCGYPQDQVGTRKVEVM